MNRKCCMRCKHAKDIFVPCDWLIEQTVIILDCPYFEQKDGDDQ